AQVEASSSQRIAKSPLFVGTKHHERYRRGRYRPKFRYRDLPGAEDLKQQCLKTLIHFVEFVDEQHARAILVTQGTEQRPFGKEIERMESPPYLLPGFFEFFALRLKKMLHQRFVEFPIRLVFVDSDIALNPLYSFM